MKQETVFAVKGLAVRPMDGEDFRYFVASGRGDGSEYLCDLEARFPATRCSCPDYDCRRWPEFKRTLVADHCKHSRAALIYHALRHIRATSQQLNGEGE